MELSHGPDGRLAASGENWKLEFDSPAKGKFTVKAGEDLSAHSEYASVNELSEESALPGKVRSHISGDSLEYSFESKTVIPFGSEPSVERSFKVSEGRLSLTTDLVMRASPGMEKITGGGFTVEGKIVSVAVFGPEGLLEKNPGEVLYDSAEPPVSVLFKSESGAELEISTGEDFWRWTAAERLGGRSRFTVERRVTEYVCTWLLYEWVARQDELPPQGRLWRFHQILAWRTASKREPGPRRRTAKGTKVFDCGAFEWPEPLRKESGAVCFSANGTVNILKKWVRSNLAELKKGDELVLKNVSVGFCRSASHQDRPGKGELAHWDLRPLLEFRRWAEKQIGAKGAVLRIQPDGKSPFRELPSLS